MNSLSANSEVLARDLEAITTTHGGHEEATGCRQWPVAAARHRWCCYRVPLLLFVMDSCCRWPTAAGGGLQLQLLPVVCCGYRWSVAAVRTTSSCRCKLNALKEARQMKF